MQTTNNSVNLQNINANALVNNANSLAINKPEHEKFAQKLASLKDQDDQGELLKEIIKKAHEGKSGEEILSFIQGDPSKLKAYKALHKTLLEKQSEMKDGKELVQVHETKIEEEVHGKLKPSEQNIATAAQVNQKQITEAVHEGNVAQQENNYQNGKSQKQRLAEWSRMAPQVTEDVRNKAVRVDIPGIDDIQTLIVRVSGTGVSIQVAGSEQAMKLLQQEQYKLKDRLAKHDIGLNELKTFTRANAGVNRVKKEKGNV